MLPELVPERLSEALSEALCETLSTSGTNRCLLPTLLRRRLELGAPLRCYLKCFTPVSLPDSPSTPSYGVETYKSCDFADPKTN